MLGSALRFDPLDDSADLGGRLLLVPRGQISPLRLMVRGSRGRVDGVLGLGLRWGLLPIPVADFDKFRQIFLLLDVGILFWTEHFLILSFVHTKLLQNLGNPVMVSQRQSSLVLTCCYLGHDSFI